MSLTLQPLLRHRYRRETRTTLLLDLFPDGAVSIFSTPAEIDVTHEQVTATRQLGHIRLADGSRIALVEVEAKSTVKLARNRIALRNFIGQLIVPGSSDAVLAVFHQPGRLTTLAERAVEFAKFGATEALRATEREIDGIVHQLFHLTPAEIALIEEAVGGPKTADPSINSK